MELIVIRPQQEKEQRLEAVLSAALAGIDVPRIIRSVEELSAAVSENCLQNVRLLFAAGVGETGINLKIYEMLGTLRENKDCLKDSVAGILVDGENEYYTKSTGREIARTMNEAGCWLVGRPLTEGTGRLKNYQVLAGNFRCSLYEAYIRSAVDLAQRVAGFEKPAYKEPKLL